MKILKLAGKIPNHIDGLIISSKENRFYFTDFSSSNGYLLILKDRFVFLTDGRYIEAAKNKIKGCEVLEISDFSKQVSDILKENKVKSLGLELEKISLAEFNKYKEMFPFIDFALDGEICKIINDLRAIKSKDEISRIKTAQEIAEAAFDYILDFIKIGKTEKEIQLELDFYMLKNGADALSFDTISVSGKNSSLPHGVPTDKKLEDGDFLTLDFGAVYKGYHSDMTRTLGLGKICDNQRFVYNTVLEAQLACIGGLHAGLSGLDADLLARDVIKSKGLGQYFTHGTGHGVGIEVHESPTLSPKSKSVLKAGNIVTVEPGVYLPGRFGVRIEDMISIEKDGIENLTKAAKDLIILN